MSEAANLAVHMSSIHIELICSQQLQVYTFAVAVYTNVLNFGVQVYCCCVYRMCCICIMLVYCSCVYKYTVVAYVQYIMLVYCSCVYKYTVVAYVHIAGLFHRASPLSSCITSVHSHDCFWLHQKLVKCI